MQNLLANPEHSVVVAVDPQPGFLKAIPNSEDLIKRGIFLSKVAEILEIPVILNEQNPQKMGSIDERLLKVINKYESNLPKNTFSCCENPVFMEQLDTLQRNQVFLWGIETHICMAQTTIQLLHEDYDVFVVADATGCRSELAHQIGIQRMRDTGAIITHSESVTYEWLGTCDHPKFRDVLAVVKEYAQ